MPRKGDNVDLMTAEAVISHNKNETMLYTPAGYIEGGVNTQSIGVIFTDGDTSAFDDMGNEVIYSSKSATCLISDVAAIEQGALISVGGANYRAESFRKINRFLVRFNLDDR